MPPQSVEIRIEGPPVPKARPRAQVIFYGDKCQTCLRGHRHSATMYTLSATKEFERRVAKAARPHFFNGMIEGPVDVRILFVFPMKGNPRKREPRPAEWKPTRPDADNLTKAVLDGLNGIAFKDDGQVCSETVHKIHAAQGVAPQTIIAVRKADPCLPETLSSALGLAPTEGVPAWLP